MLKKLFYPKSVALIGASATPGKLGFDILANLVDSDYNGEVYPINLTAEEILGKKAYKSVLDVPGTVDLAVIAVPAPFVIDVLKECVKKDIKNAVVISAGFKEIRGEGELLEQQVRDIIKKHKLNLVGPNCLGIINAHFSLNASFAEGMPEKGNIALISQSGAMAVAITDWAYEANIGFSKIVSLGNKAGVDENVCLEYLENDDETKVVMLYLESFADGVKFMEIASKIAMKKPVIVFKSGISEAGSKAVASHTGALAGSDVAVDIALERCGVIRAKTIEDFFDFAKVFSMQPITGGNKVAVVTNAGGPGVIATDAIDKSDIIELADFSKETRKALEEALPKTANTHNPVDIVGDALADRYQKAFDIVLQDKNVDMLLAILTPQIMTQKESTVRILTRLKEKYPKISIISSFMGGKNIEYYAQKLEESNIPNFIYPTRGVNAMEAMEWLRRWRNKIVDTSCKVAPAKDPSLKKEIEKASKEGKTQLPQNLVTRLLESYKIAVPKIKIAKNEKELVQFAKEAGYPIVLKIVADKILHKTDVGGVRLAIKDEEELVEAYREIIENVKKNRPDVKPEGVLVQKMYHMGREVIIGVKRDPVFGPLIMFGLGGIYVEVMKDVSFAIAPICEDEANEMINKIQAIKLLKGVRGEAPSDIKKVAETIVKISHMAMDFPQIKELDINPLMVFSKDEGVSALDARVII